MYEQLNIPQKGMIDNTIYKKIFIENAELSKADKKILSEVIHKIVWRYSLKEETCYIRPYSDDEHDYPEIELIEVDLNKAIKEQRIAEIIMHAIPYPMLLLMKHDGKVRIWVSHQRTSQADSDRNVLEELISTAWLSPDAMEEFLDFSSFRQDDCYVLYTDIIDSISLYNARDLVTEDVTGAEARQLVAKREQIQKQITSLKAQMKKETQFNHKVQLNIEIKKLEKELY